VYHRGHRDGGRRSEGHVIREHLLVVDGHALHEIIEGYRFSFGERGQGTCIPRGRCGAPPTIRFCSDESSILCRAAMLMQ
jgi:hypothetical protein